MQFLRTSRDERNTQRGNNGNNNNSNNNNNNSNHNNNNVINSANTAIGNALFYSVPIQSDSMIHNNNNNNNNLNFYNNNLTDNNSGRLFKITEKTHNDGQTSVQRIISVLTLDESVINGRKQATLHNQALMVSKNELRSSTNYDTGLNNNYKASNLKSWNENMNPGSNNNNHNNVSSSLSKHKAKMNTGMNNNNNNSAQMISDFHSLADDKTPMKPRKENNNTTQKHTSRLDSYLIDGNNNNHHNNNNHDYLRDYKNGLKSRILDASLIDVRDFIALLMLIQRFLLS
jgi:hypothetical protein